MEMPIAAIMYDFDKTLCTKDMQEYAFIPALGMEAKEFWGLTNRLTDEEQMDNILAYMYTMVEKAREKQVPVTRETFMKMGAQVEYFPGVRDWFDRITAYGAELGVQVEHYIVSSGIKEIIEGTDIAPNFKKIYACEFMYGKDGTIRWPKFAVNYTAKTQFLFRINKGVLDINSESARELNRFTPEAQRRIPFRNMIYIGDGITDVPCMRLVKANGGQSIGVYAGETGRRVVEELKKADRVNFIAPADYRPDGEAEGIVRSILKKIQAVEEMQGWGR